MWRMADKAEEQKSATEHSDAAAEDTDDAGNALAEEEDSAVAKDTATEEDGKKGTDSETGVEVSATGQNAADVAEAVPIEEDQPETDMDAATANEPVEQTEASVAQNVDEKPEDGNTVLVYINGQPVKLTGKPQYIFVDIFDFYEFDLTASNGRAIITNLNGENASYSAVLKTGDTIELRWKEN